MTAPKKTDRASVNASVGVHAGVEITLAIHGDEEKEAEIHFGAEGPDLCIDFADLDSLERLAEVAAEGVARLREASTAH